MVDKLASFLAIFLLTSGLAGCLGGSGQIEFEAELDCDYHGKLLIYLNGDHQDTVNADCMFGEYMAVSGSLTVESGDIIKVETDSDNGMNSCTITITEAILDSKYGYCTDR
ncbi:MAG: hypothetical protein O3A74_05170 [archaeon]|nr:hypothetical protein [archaeon]MDA0842344.1 hypothetical protein [archaeon]